MHIHKSPTIWKKHDRVCIYLNIYIYIYLGGLFFLFITVTMRSKEGFSIIFRPLRTTGHPERWIQCDILVWGKTHDYKSSPSSNECDGKVKTIDVPVYTWRWKNTWQLFLSAYNSTKKSYQIIEKIRQRPQFSKSCFENEKNNCLFQIHQLHILRNVTAERQNLLLYPVCHMYGKIKCLRLSRLWKKEIDYV